MECCKPTVPGVLDHFNALLSLLHDNLTCVLMTSWNHGTSMTHQTSATRVLGDFKSFLDFFDPLLDFLILRYSVGHFLTVNVFPKFRHKKALDCSSSSKDWIGTTWENMQGSMDNPRWISPLSSQRPVELTLAAGAEKSLYITGMSNTYMYRTISSYVYYVYHFYMLHKFQQFLSSDPHKGSPYCKVRKLLR